MASPKLSKQKSSKKPLIKKDYSFKIPKIPKMPKMSKGRDFWGNLLTVFLLFLILSSVYSIFNENKIKPEIIAISGLADKIEKGEVAKIIVKGDELTIFLNDEAETELESKKEVNTALSDSLVNYGVSPLSLRAVEIDIQNPSGFMFWLLNLAPFLIPLIFIVFFIWFLTRQVKGSSMQAFSFGQSKARITDPNDKSKKITFDDVAGVKEAKEELLEVVDFLRNPKKFLDIGAQIPKGVLLTGAPGTGKTLLARAVAGEANVPFFSISGSEFVEMFVGVGASRVRDLFKMAKAAAPAIIFVDEIDAVGRVRGSGIGGGNDEREQTLNQILVEMDGFEQTEKVIVMAATNRPDVLDPALLRPGRFDRRVLLDLPDREDRENILKIHSKKKPFSEDVDLSTIAERTPGFSGADLYSLMNEGAILAAREGRTKVAQYDLIRAIEKVILGPERKSHILNKAEKKIVAYHEAGHALLSSILPYADPVHKISVISRGHAAGYILKFPLEEKKLHSKKEFLADISVGLAGYVVEEMIFNDITTGPSNDLQVSTALARSMVTRYGMSDKLGPQSFDTSNKMLPGVVIKESEYSEEFSKMIDEEVTRIIKEAKNETEKIIKEHRKTLNAIAERLIEVETIEREEFETILIANGITPKKKKDIEHQE